MDLQVLPEILAAVALFFTGQKGLDFYKKKKYANGGGDRRHNHFSDSDKSFIRNCFEDQTEKMGLAMKSDRLELLRLIEAAVRTEGENTRGVVRAQR